jgi:exocyst complex component 2
VLTQYGIRDPFPTSWPSNKDDSDESDGESSPAPAPTPQLKPKVDRSKSRYTVLERTGPQRRSLVPGTEMTQDGLENLVQKDEPDPLGKTNSVVRALQASGLSVEDEKLRNQFLLSSTTFNPALFLSRVQGRSSTDELYRGLEVLSLSIDQKSASLKVLVESNFERFVRAKSTIDSVYTEMRNQGIEAEAETRRPHSRHTSRSSNHFRSISGQNLNFGKTNLRPLANEKRKHALIKESEYGVQGVKAPLVDVGVKAEEVWGAALGGKDRENTMRTVLDGIEKGDEILNLPDAIASSIKTKDYEKLVQDYTKAKNYMEESRTASDNAVRSPKAVPDNQIYRILLISKIWSQIEKQVKGLKRDVWIALTSEQANMTMSTDRSHQDDHIALISVLLSLGVKDNPIEVWLLSRYDYLLNKINMTFERSRMEIEVFRRRLGNAERPGLYASAVHYRSPTRTNTEDRIKHLDTAPILELWDLLVHAMGNLLSLQGGILGEVIDFAEKAQSFIDGEAQRSMPTGIDGRSKSHHRLSQDGLKGTHEGVLHLVNALREHIHAFFIEAPIEDISTLFSPIPHSPETPNNEAPRTPKSAALLSPFSKPDQRFNLDLLSPPPPSPRKNEFWEVFAFWPPYANSLSGVHFLSKIVLLVGTAAAEMSGIQAVMSKPDLVEQLKAMLNAVRQRSAEAVCSAWQQDANTCKVLEDWTRGPDSRDITRWPDYFSSLEAFIISGTQKILYVPEAALSKGNAAEIITPPPGNLLNKIKKQFVRSISDASFSMASNASEPMDVPQNPWSSEGIVSPLATKTDSIETSRNAVDASSQVHCPISHFFPNF